ncbi:hypothetical protein CDD81_2937 [Ophiocordyceps australis]|uniref:Uncharacterized protein n=1 Tax=Ophiocordyceps australis TaxID=1399860 RepID=A0A2C5XMU9_9HYPO|nr:hypothetical protein CDD81_2937 [Ophiocordyceps australis]
MASNPFNVLSSAALGTSNSSLKATPGPTRSAAPWQTPPLDAEAGPSRTTPRRRKNHRGGKKKKRSRRKSFAALVDDSHDEMASGSGDVFYQLAPANLSNTSIDSEALLDHREQRPMRTRRLSAMAAASSPYAHAYSAVHASRLRSMQTTANSGDDDNALDETSPLLSESMNARASPSSYGGGDSRPNRGRSRRASSKSSATRRPPALSSRDTYHINNPPSIPGSPTFGAMDHPDMSFGDVMIRDELSLRSGSPRRRSEADGSRDADRPDLVGRRDSGASEDVCFPVPGMSEMGEDDAPSREPGLHQYRARRRRGQWPDLSVLQEWSCYEKDERVGQARVKKITEPQLINGRLRPVRKGWYQTDEEAPFRFTYFNEEFQSTIHSQTISELVQPGSSFRELFIPDVRILSDDESDDDGDVPSPHLKPQLGLPDARTPTRQPSVADSGRTTPKSAQKKPVRYGDRPVWWLDVLCPTEGEMKTISKTFGIHPLTAEDIMMQEAREKVELFRHYYFVNYRTFDQDINSHNYLEPVNMYVVVFREGVLSFHFSMTPHPANVRRRIRQLRDYLILSSDWISYAIIDDITDVFQPLIQNIEDEVDEIDDQILKMHSSSHKHLDDKDCKQAGNDDNTTAIVDSGDMLRRVGDSRKRVMSLYRLLGNKADVIKGFAKRCNERWEVAPRSEIGLYLGDIQDHIVTMTSNLSHYEKILARTHGNYLAQINIRMNERQEQTADVLGKLTVLGTIVLPMNIITGLWGMNVWVPGQEYEGDLAWFVWISAGLILFGLACYMIAKRVYKIV